MVAIASRRWGELLVGNIFSLARVGDAKDKRTWQLLIDGTVLELRADDQLLKKLDLQIQPFRLVLAETQIGIDMLRFAASPELLQVLREAMARREQAQPAAPANEPPISKDEGTADSPSQFEEDSRSPRALAAQKRHRRYRRLLVLRSVLGWAVIGLCVAGAAVIIFHVQFPSSPPPEVADVPWPLGSGYSRPPRRPDAPLSVKKVTDTVVQVLAVDPYGKWKMTGTFPVRDGEPAIVMAPGAVITNAREDRRPLQLKDYHDNRCLVPYGMTVEVDEYGLFVPIKMAKKATADPESPKPKPSLPPPPSAKENRDKPKPVDPPEPEPSSAELTLEKAYSAMARDNVKRYLKKQVSWTVSPHNKAAVYIFGNQQGPAKGYVTVEGLMLVVPSKDGRLFGLLVKVNGNAMEKAEAEIESLGPILAKGATVEGTFAGVYENERIAGQKSMPYLTDWRVEEKPQ